MPEEFRIYVHDRTSPTPEAAARLHLDTEEAALMYARELCEAFNKRKDCLKNLSRYSVRVYRFYRTDLKFRSDAIFDSHKEYPHEQVGIQVVSQK